MPKFTNHPWDTGNAGGVEGGGGGGGGYWVLVTPEIMS